MRQSIGRHNTEDRPSYRSQELSDYLGKRGTEDDPKVALRTFYKDLKSESKDSFTPKPLSYRSNIVSSLQNDVYHTNSNKNIRYIRTSNGSMFPYVPNQDELREEREIKERAADHKALTNHHKKAKHVRIDINKLDISEFIADSQLEAVKKPKFRNPENQVKRKFSILDQCFS